MHRIMVFGNVPNRRKSGFVDVIEKKWNEYTCKFGVGLPEGSLNYVQCKTMPQSCIQPHFSSQLAMMQQDQAIETGLVMLYIASLFMNLLCQKQDFENHVKCIPFGYTWC